MQRQNSSSLHYRTQLSKLSSCCWDSSILTGSSFHLQELKVLFFSNNTNLSTPWPLVNQFVCSLQWFFLCFYGGCKQKVRRDFCFKYGQLLSTWNAEMKCYNFCVWMEGLENTGLKKIRSFVSLRIKTRYRTWHF